jgi:predicted GNAT superfamily acetyltransferase
MDDSVRLVELTRAAEHHAAADMFARIWRADSVDTVVSASLMTALAHCGGYVAGAYQGEELVGAAVGLLGAGHLHSHVAGVTPSQRGRGLGYGLKQHQRTWCLARGIGQIRWTYDPLVGRNAYFSLHRLGARAVEYLPDFYGRLTDGVNTGDSTDRLYVVWSLAADEPPPSDVDSAAERAAGAMVLVDRDPDDRPVLRSGSVPGGEPVLVAVPRDIEALRGTDSGLARQWRHAVGAALPSALAAGYRITGMSRDGYYLLQHIEEGT